MSKTRYILDTCVILEDPNAIFAFGEHEVVIPVEVLSETDKKKTERSEIGANAREFHRLLESVLNPTMFPDYVDNPERAIFRDRPALALVQKLRKLIG